MITRQQFLLRLDELLEQQPGTLQGDERLDTLENWDSLAMVSYVALVNEHYGTAVSVKEIATCKTVGDLADLADGTVRQ